MIEECGREEINRSQKSHWIIITEIKENTDE